MHCLPHGLCFKREQSRSAVGEILEIRLGRLALRRRQSRFQILSRIKVQLGYQVWSCARPQRSRSLPAHDVSSQSRNFLGEWNMRGEEIPVKRRRVPWLIVENEKLCHLRLILESRLAYQNSKPFGKKAMHLNLASLLQTGGAFSEIHKPVIFRWYYP